MLSHTFQGVSPSLSLLQRERGGGGEREQVQYAGRGGNVLGHPAPEVPQGAEERKGTTWAALATQTREYDAKWTNCLTSFKAASSAA